VRLQCPWQPDHHFDLSKDAEFRKGDDRHEFITIVAPAWYSFFAREGNRLAIAGDGLWWPEARQPNLISPLGEHSGIASLDRKNFNPQAAISEL